MSQPEEVKCPVCREPIKVLYRQNVIGKPTGARYLAHHQMDFIDGGKSYKVACPLSGADAVVTERPSDAPTLVPVDESISDELRYPDERPIATVQALAAIDYSVRYRVVDGINRLIALGRMGNQYAPVRELTSGEVIQVLLSDIDGPHGPLFTFGAVK